MKSTPTCNMRKHDLFLNIHIMVMHVFPTQFSDTNRRLLEHVCLQGLLQLNPWFGPGQKNWAKCWLLSCKFISKMSVNTNSAKFCIFFMRESKKSFNTSLQSRFVCLKPIQQILCCFILLETPISIDLQSFLIINHLISFSLPFISIDKQWALSTNLKPLQA